MDSQGKYFGDTHMWEWGGVEGFIGAGANTKDYPQVPSVSSTTRWLSSIRLVRKSSFDFTKPRRRSRVQRWVSLPGIRRASRAAIVHISPCQSWVQLSFCPRLASFVSVSGCCTQTCSLTPLGVHTCNWGVAWPAGTNGWVLPRQAFVKLWGTESGFRAWVLSSLHWKGY